MSRNLNFYKKYARLEGALYKSLVSPLRWESFLLEHAAKSSFIHASLLFIVLPLFHRLSTKSFKQNNFLYVNRFILIINRFQAPHFFFRNKYKKIMIWFHKSVYRSILIYTLSYFFQNIFLG